MKALTNCSGSEASHFTQLGKLIYSIPECGEEMHAGRLGVAHATELVRARGNPRCGQHLPDVIPALLEHAANPNLPFADFKLAVKRWVMMADPDGAYKGRDASNEGRTASLHESEEGLHLSADGGTAAISAEMLEIFEQFRTAEFLIDWDAAVAEHGDTASAIHMARTDAQRRFDALAAIFRAAASAPRDARISEPTVNFIVDQQTYEEHLAGILGSTTPPAGLVDPFKRRSETTNGTLVHPVDIIAASLISHVRRVVMDSAGNVIDLGRRQRLFTGSAREAVMLHSQRCIWPGCDIAAGRCQADHLNPFATTGPTAPTNGAPLCKHHNQTKNRGFATRRDPVGHWHTYRPDGTELTDPPSIADLLAA